MTNEEVVSAIKHLVGTRYEASVKPYIAELTSRTSVIGPRDISTTHIDPTRIRIRVDASENIESFTFG